MVKRALFSMVLALAIVLSVSMPIQQETRVASAATDTIMSSNINLVANSDPWDNQVTRFLEFAGGCAGVSGTAWAAYVAGIASGASAVVLVLATARCSIGIGATVGELNVRFECWQSRQWWGFASRARV